jgi:hypothetical protein
MTTSNLRFRLDNVRASFPVLFKGEQFNGEGKFRCGVSLIIPPDHPQLARVNAGLQEAAALKWKDKAAATMKAVKAKDKLCLRDGDLKAKYDGYEGNLILSANCQGGDTEAECAKPQVYDTNTVLVTEAGKNPIYSGCYVNALVEFYADSRFGDGVFAKLVGIQFDHDGDAFGSAKAQSSDFEKKATEGADAAEFA